MRSLFRGVRTNIDNDDQFKARPPSPTVSQGLISCSIVVASSEMCLVKSTSAQLPSPTATSCFKVHEASTLCPSTQHQQESQDREKRHQVESQRPAFSWGIGSWKVSKSETLHTKATCLYFLSITPSSPTRNGPRPLKRTKRYFEQSDDDVFTTDTRSQSQSAASSQESEPTESVTNRNH